MSDNYILGKQKGRDFIREDNFRDDVVLRVIEDESREILKNPTSPYQQGYAEGVLERIAERRKVKTK